MKYRLQALVFVFVAFMLGCNEYMIVGVLPDVARDFHEPLSKLGLLVTIFALVYAVCTPIITSIASRWPRHRVLLSLIGIFLVGNSWSALATSYWSMFISRVITASVAGAIISLVMVMVNFTAPRHRRASIVSWVFAGFSIASIIGIPIGTIVSHLFSWRESFWMISLLTIPVFAALLWLLPRDTPQVRSRFKKQFTLLRDQRVILGTSLIVLVCASDYTIYTYIRPLVTNVMGFSYAWLNWILFGMGVFFIIGNKFGGYIADHGGMLTLRWIYIVMTLLYLALGVTFQYKWIAALIIGLLCISFCCYGSSTQLMFMDIAESEYPASLDLASSLNAIFANIGISLGSFTASEAVQFTKMSNLGYIGVVYGLLTIVVVFTLANKYQSKNNVHIHLPEQKAE